MESILLLLYVDESGALPKSSFEALNAALDLSKALGASVAAGIVGGETQKAADSIAASGVRILAVSGAEFGQPRYATDAAAAEALCKTVEPTIVLAPSSSRWNRTLPGVAHRQGGCVDSHITEVAAAGGITASRWYYRQRVEARLQRAPRPWFLLLESGVAEPWKGTAEPAKVEQVSVTVASRTCVTGVRAPKLDEQTIRPDAKLLFVAGAGWTKKQSDGNVHGKEAEQLIKGFLKSSGASLGSSKSLVDQAADEQAVLTFMSHLNQVGQTGATPRHPKGLSTCCHGEEPHVVGWRFIAERRAINLDPNCGWARGKADVLYVADAFKVMEALNAIVEKRVAVAAV